MSETAADGRRDRADWSWLLGISVAVTLTILNLEAFGFGMSGAVGLLHLMIVPGLGVAFLAWSIKTRDTMLRRVGLALVLSAIAALGMSSMLDSRKLADSKAAGDALCLALESWHKSAGSYPQHLQELVPSLLATVPATSMGGFTSIPFDYRLASQGDDYILGFKSTLGIYCSRSRAAT